MRRVFSTLGVLLALIFVFICPPFWRVYFPSVVVQRKDSKGLSSSVRISRVDRNWTKFADIPEHLVYSLIVSEDGSFFSHWGLDLYELKQSLQTNIEKGRYVRGGSTLTQQLVKNVFLSKSKTLTRKAREAIGALLLEGVTKKQTILEWYFNVVEFGKGIYGIEDASKAYFDKAPSQLSLLESLQLVAILPNPVDGHKQLKSQSISSGLQKKMITIAYRLLMRRKISERKYNAVLIKNNKKDMIYLDEFAEPTSKETIGEESTAE